MALTSKIDVLRPRAVFVAFPLILAVAARVRGRSFRVLLGASALGLALLSTYYALPFPVSSAP